MGTEKTQTTTDIVECHQQNSENIKFCDTPENSSVIKNCDCDANDDIYVLNIEIDENNVIDGAKEILTAIRSDWNLDDVQFKLFTDGITNKLVGCFKTCTTATSSAEPNDVVLVRIYGKKTDMLIDRTAETKNIRLLHTYGFAPTLFAVFQNGLAYEYVPGVTLTPQTVLEPKIWTLIARRMAEMHKVEIIPDMTTNINCNQNKNRVPMLWSKAEKFLDLVPDKFTDHQKHLRLTKSMPTIAELRTEWKYLYEQLEILGSPTVFAHNDLLLGNIIYTENLDRVTFIDYEYAAYNFQAFDIGNHFNEFAGIDEIDYSRYPSKEFQMKWLRVYLETYLNTDNISTNQIEHLYVQANQFALASHILWTIWALIQTEHSTIDFDFVKFAQMRYGEYLAKKDHFLALKC